MVLFCFVCQECPSGVVNEETFKEIYAQFFPQGGLFRGVFDERAKREPAE